MNQKPVKKNSPLTKAQSNLLKESLKKLLGYGLLEEPQKKPSEVKAMVIKDALNAIVLKN